MWKKIFVIFISLVGTFSMVYAVDSQKLFATSTYYAGGTVTGRINQKPSNLIYASGNTSIGFQKGDKVYIGVENPLNNAPLGWQLMYYDYNYDTYDITVTGDDSVASVDAVPLGKANAWFVMATDAITDPINAYDSLTPAYENYAFTNYWLIKNADTENNATKAEKAFSADQYGKMKNPELIQPMDYTYLLGLMNAPCKVTPYTCDMVRATAKVSIKKQQGLMFYFSDLRNLGSSPFNSSIDGSKIYGGFHLTEKDLGWKENYFTWNNEIRMYNNVKYYYTSAFLDKNGKLVTGENLTTKRSVRLSTMLDLENVVFSTAEGSSTSIAKIDIPKLSTSYTNIYTDASKYNTMKLRLYNPSMSATLQGIESKDEVEIESASINSSILVHASANTGASAEGVNTVSAIIFDKEGNYKYYKPLEPAKGLGKYELDLADIPKGKYQIGIVNEVYNEGSAEPANSSKITDVLPLEIVEPHTITYKATPQRITTYEHTKNVNPSDKIGEITRMNGAAPISYEIMSDGDDSFRNFEITDLGSNKESSATNLNVQVKSVGAPDIVKESNSLKVGTYKFCIESKDATGSPTVSEVGKNKICTSLTVNKTTPTISFTTTTQKDMAIGDSAFIDSITTSNTDTLASTDVTYSLSGGITGVLSTSTVAGDPLNYQLDVVASHSGVGIPATFNLTASIKETDNFNATSTSTLRKVYVYNVLSGLTWAPTKGSFSTTEVNAMNIAVGTLLAKDGIGPYTYEVVSASDANYDPILGADNASFQVTNIATPSGTSVQVKTKSALSSNTYKIQFKVTDAKGKAVYTNGEITVTAKGQSALEFKDKAGGSIITTIGQKVKFDNTSNKLIAEGGSTSSPIQYDFAPAGMQPSGVNPASYATINASNGLITPIRTGTIKVQATRPGDATYDSVTSYMDLTIDPAPQSIEFNNKSSIVNIQEGKTLKVDAQGKITSSGLAGKGGVLYTSSDPTIASVDPSSGDVTGIKAGTATITAILNSSDPSNTNFESNYDSVTATKAIKIYEPMSITWSAQTPNIKAEDNAIGDTAGTINVSNNIGAVDYVISTVSTPENVDASFFQVIGSGTSAQLQLAKVVSAIDQDNHGGTFKVQVEVSDANGTQTLNIVAVIDEADNDIYFTDGASKITALTRKYGENGNTFNLTSYSQNSGSATYGIASTDTSGTLSVLGTGAVTIHKAGSAIVQVIIGSGSGYAGGTITMPVTIEKGDQAIAFKDTTTLNQQFVPGATFTEQAELKETSKNTVSTRKVTYASNTTSVCTIDAVGTITMVSKGICDIEATNDDSNWRKVTSNKKINLYDGMGATFVPTTNLQAETVNSAANAKAGDIIVSGGIGTKTYAISTASGELNQDASLFKVNGSGVVSFTKAVSASDLVGKYDPVKKVYQLYVQIDTSDSGGTSITTDAIIAIEGAPLNASFDTGGIGRIIEEYGLEKTFTLSLASNKGGGTPTYQLKADSSMPSDVLDGVDASGLVSILHANDKKANPNDVMVEAIIPASNGYDEETIEVVVEITKAPQPDFAFKTPNIKLGHGASITPMFTGNLSTGTITMTSGNNALATINGSDIVAKTTDGSVVVTAINSGDRDYKDATATANVTISSAPAYNFVINVPAATYGDTSLKAAILINGATGANQVQTWSSSDPSIAEIDADKNITIKKAGTVTISCTQTSTGEPSVTATAVMVIDPKPITVTIDNASKYVGEAVPTFSAVIPTDDLVGSDTLGQPTFSCKDGTALVKPDTKAGTYDITGTYPTSSYPNYNITVQKGILTIKQDASLPAWFHLEGATSKTTLDGTKWVNEDVNVVLDEAIESAGTYDEISLDKTLWGTTHIINKEGIIANDVHFRINATNAIASSQPTSVKIDKTKPIMKSITGTPAKRNALSELLNSITFGKYFKPQLEVSVQAEDVLPQGVEKNSGLKNIHYIVYQIKDDSTLGDEIANGDMSTTDTLKLVDEGKYLVCATAQDNAGNQSAELCSGIRIKSIGDDSDDDGIPDLNIDTDGDGIPDLNITKNKDDKLPWLNIDTDGDGIADMNIDKDDDGKPDLNTGVVTTWKPNKEVDLDKDGKPDYKTDITLKGINNIDSDKDGYPDINIDRDLDGIPELNIDTDQDFTKPEIDIDGDGDGIRDINIDENNDGTPDKNIVEITTWKPDVDVKENGKVIYDTMKITFHTKDELEDNGIVIKPSKPGQVFLPNYALKVDDITDRFGENAKKEIIEITGSKSEVKHVYDVSLSDGNKTIQPDGSIIVRVPIDIAIKNPRILLQNKAGNFEEVEGTIENGYFVFETDYLGQVSIVGDKEEVVDPSNPKDPTPDTKPSTQHPQTSVKGNYTSSMGGALTGDNTDIFMIITLMLGSGFIIGKASYARRKKGTE